MSCHSWQQGQLTPPPLLDLGVFFEYHIIERFVRIWWFLICILMGWVGGGLDTALNYVTCSFSEITMWPSQI